MSYRVSRALLNAGHLLGSASIELESEGEVCPVNRCACSLRRRHPDAKLLQPDPKAPAAFDYGFAKQRTATGYAHPRHLRNVANAWPGVRSMQRRQKACC
jgi:hypothetical protein